jgi:hypothetical protein
VRQFQCDDVAIERIGGVEIGNWHVRLGKTVNRGDPERRATSIAREELVDGKRARTTEDERGKGRHCLDLTP